MLFLSAYCQLLFPFRCYSTYKHKKFKLLSNKIKFCLSLPVAIFISLLIIDLSMLHESSIATGPQIFVINHNKVMIILLDLFLQLIFVVSELVDALLDFALVNALALSDLLLNALHLLVSVDFVRVQIRKCTLDQRSTTINVE